MGQLLKTGKQTGHRHPPFRSAHSPLDHCVVCPPIDLSRLGIATESVAESDQVNC